MTAELVLAALNMALQQRRPDGVIRHSDQGTAGACVTGTTPLVVIPAPEIIVPT